MNLSIAISVNVFPGQHRGKAIGILSMVQSAGLVGGPALGGFIVGIFDWPAIFYIRIPVGIIGLGMALFIIKEQKKHDSHFQLDLVGAAALLIGVTVLLLYLNLGAGWRYISLQALTLLAISIFLFSYFYYLEARVP